MQDAATPERAPSLADAVGAYLLVRDWLDRDALPAEESPALRTLAREVEGVCVILRLDGRVVGVGQDSRGGAQMLRRATGEAISKALGDEVIRSVRTAAGDKVTARLSLEIELAGPLSPLVGRTIADAALRLVPGQDGIAVRRGEQTVRAFPSRLALTDLADRPAGVIASLLSDAGLPPKDLHEFATDERVSLARFATVRMRGDSPSAGPTEVTRGGRTVGLHEIGPNAAAALASVLAARLAGEVIDVPAGPADPTAQPTARLRGTFDPTHSRYEPLLGGPRDEAIALVALALAAQSDAIAAPLRDGARASAAKLLRSVVARADDERTAMLDAACALAAKVAVTDDAVRALIAERARARLDAELALAKDAKPDELAYAAVAVSAGNPDASARAAEAVRALLERAREQPAVTGRAILPLALLLRAGALPADAATDVRAALGQLARALAERQIAADSDAGRGMPADLVGGLAPGAARFDVRASALTPFAALAIGRIEAFKPMQRPALRFLAQHVANDPWVGGFRSPDALRGLVRESLGGNECPPDRLATGLLFALAAAENG